MKSFYTNIVSNTWLYSAVIALAALTVYFNTFQVPFIFDDIRQIVENRFIRSLDNFLSLEILKKNRPFVDLTFALNYHFGGLEVFGYHLVNLIIHTINGILVYFLVFKVLSRLSEVSRTGYIHDNTNLHRFMALFTALIFIVHPLQTQAVTYIVQRYTSLAATFYLLAVLIYISARNKQLVCAPVSHVFFLFFLSFISGILAFLCKQSAASLPAAILCVEFVLLDRTWSGWRKKLVWIFPSLLLMVLFFFYNVGFFSGQRQLGGVLEEVSVLMRETEDISRWHYLLTQFNVLPKYLFQFLIPIGQNADPMFPVIKSFWKGFTPLGFVFIMLIFAAGIMAFKRMPVITFAIFWFFITISIESSIIPIKDTMFEHRMYLPLVGPAILTASAAGLFFLKYCRQTLVLSLSILIIFGLLAHNRNNMWQNAQVLWSDSVEKNPENFRAHTNLALSLESEGEINKALYHYHRALRLKPDFAYAHMNLGALLGEFGQVAEAEYHFRQARKELPNNPKVLNNLGVALANQNKFENALNYFRQAVGYDRYHIEARINIALTLINLKKFSQAKHEIGEILKLDPDNVQANNLLKIIE